MNHWKGMVDFSHFKGKNLGYTMDSVYNHTKLHNVICTNELARRLQGTGVTANSVHPGLVMTEIMRHYNFMVRFLFNMIGIFFFKVNILNHNTLVKIIHTVHCLPLYFTILFQLVLLSEKPFLALICYYVIIIILCSSFQMTSK
ncbi:unnamed protein product [Oncorhynchus mykiss]|uniref:Uncharacterized protein n=1 Tax=Oncorhynchus mykiss TaxID=8022 RepID=A0A060Z1E0_ONCMY|nr:unnamed protein product [Oncorhynchus mykiss]